MQKSPGDRGVHTAHSSQAGCPHPPNRGQGKGSSLQGQCRPSSHHSDIHSSLGRATKHPHGHRWSVEDQDHCCDYVTMSEPSIVQEPP